MDLDVSLLHPKQQDSILDEASSDADDLIIEYTCVHCVHFAKKLPPSKRPPKTLDSRKLRMWAQRCLIVVRDVGERIV